MQFMRVSRNIFQLHKQLIINSYSLQTQQQTIHLFHQLLHFITISSITTCSTSTSKTQLEIQPTLFAAIKSHRHLNQNFELIFNVFNPSHSRCHISNKKLDWRHAHLSRPISHYSISHNVGLKSSN